jgi:hypothetical protein
VNADTVHAGVILGEVFAVVVTRDAGLSRTRRGGIDRRVPDDPSFVFENPSTP